MSSHTSTNTSTKNAKHYPLYNITFGCRSMVYADVYICLYSYYFRNYKYRHNITYVTYVVYMLFTIYYILNHMITYILSVNLVCAIYPCIIPITI